MGKRAILVEIRALAHTIFQGFTEPLFFMFCVRFFRLLCPVYAKPRFTFTFGSSPLFYEVKPDSVSSERLSKLECCVP